MDVSCFATKLFIKKQGQFIVFLFDVIISLRILFISQVFLLIKHLLTDIKKLKQVKLSNISHTLCSIKDYKSALYADADKKNSSKHTRLDGQFYNTISQHNSFFNNVNFIQEPIIVKNTSIIITVIITYTDTKSVVMQSIQTRLVKYFTTSLVFAAHNSTVQVNALVSFKETHTFFSDLKSQVFAIHVNDVLFTNIHIILNTFRLLIEVEFNYFSDTTNVSNLIITSRLHPYKTRTFTFTSFFHVDLIQNKDKI